MLKKMLSACILGGACFGVSYCMEPQSSATPEKDPIKIIEKLAVGQLYGDLYSQVRANIKMPGLSDLIKTSVNATGDVCMLYHLCRNLYKISKASDVQLAREEMMNMQKWYIILLMRVYMDVAASNVLHPCEDVYEMFRSKICNLWAPFVSSDAVQFHGVVTSAITNIKRMITTDKFPSPIWACFCTRAYGSSIGFYPNTINFYNVDARYDSDYTTKIRDINLAKYAAIEKIMAKALAISTNRKSNLEKWNEFLNLKFGEI